MQQPTKIPDHFIATLISEQRDGVVKLPDEKAFKRNDLVRVRSFGNDDAGNSFLGRIGLYHSTAPHDCVRILLNFLGSQRIVTMKSSLIEAA